MEKHSQGDQQHRFVHERCITMMFKGSFLSHLAIAMIHFVAAFVNSMSSHDTRATSIGRFAFEIGERPRRESPLWTQHVNYFHFRCSQARTSQVMTWCWDSTLISSRERKEAARDDGRRSGISWEGETLTTVLLLCSATDAEPFNTPN